MTRLWITIALGSCLVACAKPEAEPAAVGEAPAVAAPELEPEPEPEPEQVEYVDPLEAARAAARAQAQNPGDASWREGFDHRAPADPGEPESPEEPPPDQPARNAPVEDPRPAAPPADATPTFSEPLPALDGAPPQPGGARHPDDAQPPPR